MQIIVIDLLKIDCARNLEQLQSSVVHIFGTDQDINNWKQTWSTAISYLLDKKSDELCFTNKKVIDADVDLPKFKIRHNFGQLQTLTANMSGADRHTENW